MVASDFLGFFQMTDSSEGYRVKEKKGKLIV